MHNALQGGEINLSELKREIYEEVVFENSVRMHIDHDLVIVHDPQPLPHRSFPQEGTLGVALPRRPVESQSNLWSYLTPFIERYDAVVLSLPEYAQKITPAQRFIMPAINPSRRPTRSCRTQRSTTGSIITISRPTCRSLCRCRVSISGRIRKA